MFRILITLVLTALFSVADICADVYKVKLATVQPYTNLVTIECYVRYGSTYETIYNQGEPETVAVAKETFYIENVDPVQAVMLGCRQLDTEIVDYALYVCQTCHRQMNIPALIRIAQEANNDLVFWYKVFGYSFFAPGVLAYAGGIIGGAATLDMTSACWGIAAGTMLTIPAGVCYLINCWKSRNKNRIIAALEGYGRN